MPNVPDVLTAYMRRRGLLESQLQAATANVVQRQLQDALFVGEVAAAAFYDLCQVLGHVGDQARRGYEAYAQAADGALADVRAALDACKAPDPDPADAFIGVLAALRCHGAGDLFELQMLKGELLQSLGIAWLGQLHSLYTDPDRQLFFDRLDKLFGYALTKIPVVGEVLDTIRTAAEVYAIGRRQAQDADKYMRSLESYFDAGNVCVVGILTFCEHADRMVAGRPPPDQRAISDRLAAHIHAVSEGTHPASAHPDA